MQINNFKLANILLNRYVAGLVVFLLIFLFYSIGGFHNFSTNYFFYHYSDLLFISLILITIYPIQSNKNKIDSIFWHLQGAGFIAWLILSIAKIYFWKELSESKQELYSSISYFLFYSLMIASVEVRAYSNARKFLNSKSLVSSISILVFILGAFSFFVIARYGRDSKMQSAFYLTMDGYLFFRWIHLSWQSRKNKHYFIGFLLLGIASANWFISDSMEFLLKLDQFNQINTLSNPMFVNWFDWLWHMPFLIYYFGIIKLSSFWPNSDSSLEQAVPKFSRYNLLNTPLFFLAIISLTFSFNTNFLLQTNSSLLKNIQLTWIVTTIVLAMIQAFQLFSHIKKQKYELKKTQKQLNINQQKLSQLRRNFESKNDANQILLDTINNPIFTLSIDGQVLSVNKATCDLLGYPEEKIVGSRFSDHIPKTEELSYFFDYQSYRQKLARKKNGLELESKIITQNEIVIEVHVSISQNFSNKAALFENGYAGISSDNIIVSLADIRKQKQVENQLHQLKDDITANISHEFRTPLTIINGIINELMAQSLNKPNQEKLNIAKRNNHRLIHMVDQLLELSKSSGQSLPIIDLDASNWLPLICKSYKTIAKEKDIHYSISLCENILIKGNQQACENILYNLLSNAFKYTNGNGRVSIELIERPDDYQLEVSDTGIGIPSSEQALVFERFHRVVGTSSHNPGVGIGLSLVKSLITSMSWDISLRSRVNHGSTFTIYIKKATSSIPKISQQVEASFNAELQDSTNEIKTPSINRKKSQYLILVIEDNVDMQKYIQSVLSPFHQCIVANDGIQGLQMAEDILPDIIVSDVMMPKMDGFSVLQKIKEQEHTNHIPVILLTAKSDKKSRIKGLSGEADDYLTKPFDADELVLKVTNLLNTRKKLQQKFESQWQGFNQTGSKEAKTIENEFLTKLNLLFEQNYSDSSFAMNQLASLLAMSERQLQRKVKALVDVSPLELLKRYRLEKSKIALRGETQIGLIAQNCGFSSQTYYGRCFKERYGLTPKAFQKQ